MKLATLFSHIFLIIFLCSCCKTIKVSTEIISGLNYVEPAKCMLDKDKTQRYKTKILGEFIAFDNKNITIFLQNFYNTKTSLTKYIKCLERTNEYYKNLIKNLVK